MSDYATARAIRDATHTLVLTLALCSVFTVVVLPITSVVVAYTAAKWKAETWAEQLETATEEAETQQGRPGR